MLRRQPMARRRAEGRHAVEISFASVECGCGASRVRGVACPDCGRGAAWFEVDVESQRRTRIAVRCIAALDDSQLATSRDPIEPFSGDHLAQFAVLAALPSNFLEALEALDRPGQGSVDDLVQACVAIGGAAQSAAAMPRLRPWIRTDHVAKSSASAMVEMARLFLEAFSAPTPIVAQQSARAAQASLDEVTLLVAELNSLRTRWERIDDADAVGDWITEALADAGEVRGITDFVSLDAAGRDLYRDVAGRNPGDGAGLGLLVSDVFSQYVGDEVAFHQAIAAADQFLVRHDAAFVSALSRPIVVDELRNGFLLMADQAQLTNAAIAAALNDRQAVRAAVDLLHTVFEGPGRRMVALLLDLDSTVRFEETLPADGASTIQKARERADLMAVTYGFDAALRIAKAHQSYEIHADHLALRMRQRGTREGQVVRITLDELLDRVLASVECLNAVALAIQVRALEHDVDLVGSEALAALGLGPSQLGAALLKSSGYESEFSGGHVRLIGPKLTASAVTLIALSLPDELVTTIDLTTPTGRIHYELNVGMVRESSAMEEGLSKEIHFQRLLSHVKIDGALAWPASSMERWVVGRAMQTLQGRDALRAEFGAIMRELRQLVNFSHSEHLAVAEEVRALMRYLRLTYEGRQFELDHHVFDRLAAYLPDEDPADLPFEYQPTSG